MPLVNCRECQAQVSTEAKSCPHCGCDNPDAAAAARVAARMAAFNEDMKRANKAAEDAAKGQLWWDGAGIILGCICAVMIGVAVLMVLFFLSH